VIFVTLVKLKNMKEIIINVPEDSVSFVEEFVERIGGSIGSENIKPVKKNKVSKNLNSYKLSDYFGSWPDIDLDPKTYRKQIWGKRIDLL
jgi:hypothetical protein